jgi:hypothetical protein
VSHAALLRSSWLSSRAPGSYDPFSSQKLSAFRSSGSAINQLATTVEELVHKAEAAVSNGGRAATSGDGWRVSALRSPA